MSLLDKLNLDAQTFWNELRAERNANPPRQKEIVVEVTQTVETEIIEAPKDEILSEGTVA